MNTCSNWYAFAEGVPLVDKSKQADWLLNKALSIDCLMMLYMRTCDDGVGVKYASTWMMEFKKKLHIEDWEYKSIYIDTIIATYILGWNDTCVGWVKKLEKTGNRFKLVGRFILV